MLFQNNRKLKKEEIVETETMIDPMGSGKKPISGKIPLMQRWQ
jgi:hypothetical protein